MKSNYQLSSKLVEELKKYLEKCEQGNQVSLLSSVKLHLRSVVAIDIKSHPKLLFIYNEFQRLKDILGQHIVRKEQLLFPFLSELVTGDEPGHVVNGKAVNTLLMVFSSENEKIISLMRSIDEAAANYKIEVNYPPSLKQAFTELKQLSHAVNKSCETENELFLKVNKSHKESYISKIRRA